MKEPSFYYFSSFLSGKVHRLPQAGYRKQGTEGGIQLYAVIHH